jgi:HSP20 family protein
MYRSLFPRDLFADFDRLQRDVGGLFDFSPSAAPRAAATRR